MAGFESLPGELLGTIYTHINESSDKKIFRQLNKRANDSVQLTRITCNFGPVDDAERFYNNIQQFKDCGGVLKELIILNTRGDVLSEVLQAGMQKLETLC